MPLLHRRHDGPLASQRRVRFSLCTALTISCAMRAASHSSNRWIEGGSDGRGLVAGVSVALAAAVVAAVIYGAAAVLQAVGAQRASSSVEGRATFRQVARQGPYLAGLGCDLVAWVLTVMALRRLPLFAVQTIVAGSLAVTVVLAHVVLRTPLRRTDQAAIAATVVGLVLIGAAASGQTSIAPSAVVGVLALAGAPMLAIVGLAARGLPSVVAASVAGMAFAGSLFSARATHLSDGIVSLVTEPSAWAVLGYGTIGLVSYARALEAGHVGSATAAMWATEIVVASVLGWLVLNDGVREGWHLVAGTGLLLAVASTVTLARSPAHAIRL